jgi:hypothetical protein
MTNDKILKENTTDIVFKTICFLISLFICIRIFADHYIIGSIVMIYLTISLAYSIRERIVIKKGMNEQETSTET